jgi:hypothetical protein
MFITISEFDRNNAFRAAIWNVAKFHNIPNCDYKANQELYYEIIALDSPLLNSLTNYLEAYDKWFKFYIERKKIEDETKQEYFFSNSEKATLSELIAERQDTLQKLQSDYDELKSNN